ncbi:MAG: hypothetical protein C4B59_03165 [Candidatus Methanogaster sp.]|uniref:Uncharacterized protein n=1 Tax=Candidatus Methanogaster sp. TaxID=3386292 RepID=A0AC61L5F4_9EURY|nr:MAG: hypothetical protein C4B59_03165 [ANME-2 cluster archaeon]
MIDMAETNSIDDEIIKKVKEDMAMYISTKDLIKQEFDELFLQSVRGEDISFKISNLTIKIPDQFRIISAVFQSSDDSDAIFDILAKAGQSEDVIQELMDFKRRYSKVLKPEFDRCFLKTAENRINSWTNVSNRNSMDMDRNIPMIDLIIHSYGREILHIRDDVDDILYLSASLMGTVIESMEICTEDGVLIDDSTTESMRDHLSKINRQLNELNNLIEKMPVNEVNISD